MNATQFFESEKLNENESFTANDMKLFAETYLQHYLREELMSMYRKNIDWFLISNIEMGGIDPADYPDFSDAYIVSCDYKGNPANQELLDVINENREFVYSAVIEHTI